MADRERTSSVKYASPTAMTYAHGEADDGGDAGRAAVRKVIAQIKTARRQEACAERHGAIAGRRVDGMGR